MKVIAFLFLLAVPGAAEEAVTIRADVSHLPKAQRMWLSLLARDSAGFSNSMDESVVADSLRGHARTAEAAGLPNVSAYLNAVAASVPNRDVTASERAWYSVRENDPVVVILRLDGDPSHPPIRDLLVSAVARRNRDLSRLAEHLGEFEQTWPGFSSRWEGPAHTRRAILADLLFRRGPNQQMAPTGTYLPFDTALRAEMGREYIFYGNVIRDQWTARELVPVARELLDPSSRALVTPEAHQRFYTTRFLTYNIGTEPPSTFTAPTRDAILIAKADLLGVLGDKWMSANGSRSAENLGTLVAMNFFSLNAAVAGKAPAPHKEAAAIILNTLIADGALIHERESWRLDVPAAEESARTLAATLLNLEARGDADEAALFFAQFAIFTPALESSLGQIRSLIPPRGRVVMRVRGL